MKYPKNNKLFFVSRIEEFCYESIEENRKLHLHEYYTIFYITEGEAVHATPYIEYTLIENSILFVPPDLEHQMILGKGCTGFHIAFNKCFFDFKNKCDDAILKSNLFNNPDFYTVIRTDLTSAPVFLNIINSILEEQKKRETYFEEVVINYLMIFLFEAKRLHDVQYPVAAVMQDKGRILLQFKKLIEDNFTKAHDVTFYAEKLAMTTPQLNAQIKKLAGITAGEFIRNRILDEAKKLIYSTSHSSKEIGYQLGFVDPAYFSRFFKKYIGHTLQTYRDIIHKKYNKSN